MKLGAPKLPKLTRFKSISLRDLLITAAPPLIIVAVVLWVAYKYIDPLPPHRVVMATGPKNSGYSVFGKRYQDFLKLRGIELELRESTGSLDNLHQINDDNSEVQIGFVQSGLTEEETGSRDGLISLGSLFSEPLWVFSHRSHPARSIAGLRGLRVNIGSEGSGLPQLARRLLRVNELDGQSVTLSMLDDSDAVAAFDKHLVDVVMFSSAPNSPTIQSLLHDRTVTLMPFPQAEAYTRQFPYLRHLTLPKGIVSFNDNLPSRDLDLIGPTAALVVTDGTHPAIVELLVQAAAEIHGSASWFGRSGEFPNDQYSEIPISPAAERYYKSGPPLLQRYLPFWIANLVERMWVVLLSLIALLLPLSRVLPPLYTWRVRSRVYRWYGQLREVEHIVDESLDTHAASGGELDLILLGEQLKVLEGLDVRVNRLSVPLSYADELYALRQHIQLVREKIKRSGGVSASGTAHG